MGEDQIVERLDSEALQALQRRDFASARRALESITALRPDDIAYWLKLAGICRAQGDLASAISAVERGLVAHPRNFHALLMMGSLLERRKDPGAAKFYEIAIGLAPPEEHLDSATRQALEHARVAHRQHVAGLGTFLRDRLSANLSAASALERHKIDLFIDDALGLRKRFRQEPAQFYYPRLPDIEFYERELFPWLPGLEAAYDDVLEELNGVLATGAEGFTPYVEYPPYVPADQWEELNHNPRWGAFHMLKHGERIAANADRCPKTMAAVAQCPQPVIKARGPNAMFSALAPQTHIPPHEGVSNVRLVCHLPLIVPEGCTFRVGNETRPWRAGQAWVFDDNLNHEAHNQSDEVRIIFMFDVWNPFLNETEKALIAETMGLMDEFLGLAKDSGL